MAHTMTASLDRTNIMTSAGMDRLCQWIRSHGNVAHVVGASVEIHVPWHNVCDGTSGVTVETVYSVSGARRVLGY